MPKYSERTLQSNTERLTASYPGRGIVVGKLPLGHTVIQAYWVMGRSDNSRNRVLIEAGGTVRTEAFDPSKVTDPSLIIYNAMATAKNPRRVGERVNHIVSNGDQTDTIVAEINSGGSFTEALDTRDYEPDAPNYTPRISGMTSADSPDTTAHALSVISKHTDSASSDRRSWLYMDKNIQRGTGYCVHTYDIHQEPDAPLPSFVGNPFPVNVPGETVSEAGMGYWDLLDKANRVALVVKGISLVGEPTEYAIFNQLER